MDCLRRVNLRDRSPWLLSASFPSSRSPHAAYHRVARLQRSIPRAPEVSLLTSGKKLRSSLASSAEGLCGGFSGQLSSHGLRHRRTRLCGEFLDGVAAGAGKHPTRTRSGRYRRAVDIESVTEGHPRPGVVRLELKTWGRFSSRLSTARMNLPSPFMSTDIRTVGSTSGGRAGRWRRLSRPTGAS